MNERRQSPRSFLAGSLVTLALLASLAVAPAAAAIRGETYEKLMNDPQHREMIRAYVLGVGTAFELVNTDARATGKGAPLYCPPAGQVMTTQRYTDILDIRLNRLTELKEDRRLPEDFMPLVETELLRGLQETFPC
jgi:hypothetical protein